MSADPRLARSRPQQQLPTAVPPPPPPPPMGVDGASDVKDVVPDDKFKLKFCTICASNQNRYASLILSSLSEHTS